MFTWLAKNIERPEFKSAFVLLYGEEAIELAERGFNEEAEEEKD